MSILDLLDSQTVTPSRPLNIAATTGRSLTSVMTGGKEVPPNKDWTPCVFVVGVGLVEFRCINGTVELRGTLKQSVSAVGSHTNVRQMPKGTEAYWPTTDLNFTTYGIDTGTAYRVPLVRITTGGLIQIAAPTGKYDGIDFAGIAYQVY